jgi:hypothetical protein
MIKWAWFLFWTVFMGLVVMLIYVGVYVASWMLFFMTRVNLIEIDYSLEKCETLGDCRDYMLENL